MTAAIMAFKTDVSHAENQKEIEKTKENNNLTIIENVPKPEDIFLFEDSKPHKLFISDILY
jgi:hypothetical protein